MVCQKSYWRWVIFARFSKKLLFSSFWLGRTYIPVPYRFENRYIPVQYRYSHRYITVQYRYVNCYIPVQYRCLDCYIPVLQETVCLFSLLFFNKICLSTHIVIQTCTALFFFKLNDDMSHRLSHGGNHWQWAHSIIHLHELHERLIGRSMLNSTF